jgi:RHS repeat-associated protein
LRFPGQYFQLETGLAYNWHRHYDPVTGRYIQPDPLRFVDGPSIYAYAVSSPFMKTDRDGLHIEGPGGVEIPLYIPPIPPPVTDFLKPWVHNHPIGPQMCAANANKEEECKSACDAAFAANIVVCKMLRDKRNRALCYDQAHELYATCLKNCSKGLPNLD